MRMRVSLMMTSLRSSLRVLKRKKEQIVREQHGTKSAQIKLTVSVQWRHEPIIEWYTTLHSCPDTSSIP